MNAYDRATFSSLISSMWLVHGREIDEVTLVMYWDALEDLDLAEVEKAVKHFTREGGEHPPKPATLRHHLRPSNFGQPLESKDTAVLLLSALPAITADEARALAGHHNRSRVINLAHAAAIGDPNALRMLREEAARLAGPRRIA